MKTAAAYFPASRPSTDKNPRNAALAHRTRANSRPAGDAGAALAS